MQSGTSGGGETWPASVTDRLLEQSADLSCVTDFEGNLVEVSPGWAELFGFASEDHTGQSMVEFVHPDDRAEALSCIRAGVAGQDIPALETRFIGRDTSSIWLRWTAVADPDSRRIYAVGQDLTDQRAAEERVGESERRYADLIESSHDIVQSITPDGHFEFVNKAWHDHLGYSEAELADVTLFDIVVEADHDHCSLLIGQIMQGQSFDSVEVTFVAKDGHTFPVEGNATGRFRDGEFVATHTFFRDVTDRKHAEELAAQYQRQLEEEVAERTAALVQSEKLATLGRLSAGMAHELNNPASAAQRGASLLRDALGSISDDFLVLGRLGFTEDDSSRLEALIESVTARAGEPDTLDPLSRSDREGDVEDWLRRHGVTEGWELAGPIISLGLCTDDLDAIAGEFTAAQMPAVLSLMTHTYTAYALLEQVGHGSQRISAIVRALKDYSFMDRAPVQDTDIHDGLDNTLVMLQAKLKGGVEVERDYDRDLPHIEALGSELNQVWTNLIDNAVDAMDGTGHLAVRTSAAEHGVVVEISDDGPGIPDKILDKIFDPFFTTKGPGKGTGLGLNIVFNMVRGAGGRIDVESAPGRTVFRVELPLTRDQSVTEGVDA